MFGENVHGMPSPVVQRLSWLKFAFWLMIILSLTGLSAWIIDERDNLLVGILVWVPAVWLAWPRRN